MGASNFNPHFYSAEGIEENTAYASIINMFKKDSMNNRKRGYKDEA